MKTNVGSTDRIIRLALGLALAVLAFVTQVYWLLVPAAIGIITGVVRFCPLWLAMRINTAKAKMGLK